MPPSLSESITAPGHLNPLIPSSSISNSTRLSVVTLNYPINLTYLPKNILLQPDALILLIATPDGSFVAQPGNSYQLAFDGTRWQALSSNIQWYQQQPAPAFSLPPSLQQLTGSKTALAPGTLLPSSQGSSLALSSDGLTLAIGAPDHNQGIGCVWIYIRSSPTSPWSQQGQRLVGSNSKGRSQQGWSVALSGDGTMLAVGAPADNERMGRVWLYRYAHQRWNELPFLPLRYVTRPTVRQGLGHASTRPRGDQLGWSLALSADGKTLAIGIPGLNFYYAEHLDEGTAIGKTMICSFDESTGSWVGKQMLEGLSSGGPQSAQGYSCSLSDDGRTVAIGSFINCFNVYPSEAFVFTNEEGDWRQQEYETFRSDNKVVRTGQGRMVSLSGDGSTLAVCGFSGDTGCSSTWIYRLQKQQWRLQTMIVHSQATSTSHTLQLARLSSDGRHLLIFGLLNYIPTFWSHSQFGESWPQIGAATQFEPNPFAHRTARASLALAAQAGSFAFAVPEDFEGIGGVLTMTPDRERGRRWTQSPLLQAYDNPIRLQHGSGFALSADGLTMALGSSCDSNNKGAVWIFARGNSTESWEQQGEKLQALHTLGAALEGTSLAFDGTGGRLLVGCPGHFSGQGCAVIYQRERGQWGRWKQEAL